MEQDLEQTIGTVMFNQVIFTLGQEQQIAMGLIVKIIGIKPQFTT